MSPAIYNFDSKLSMGLGRNISLRAYNMKNGVAVTGRLLIFPLFVATRPNQAARDQRVERLPTAVYLDQRRTHLV
jgi:hypothetical protein